MAERQSAEAFNVPQASPPSKKVQTDANRPQPVAPVDTVGIRCLPPMVSPTLHPVVEEQLPKFRAEKAKADVQAARKSESSGSAAFNSKSKNSNISTSSHSRAKVAPKEKETESQRRRTVVNPQQAGPASKPQTTNGELKSKTLKGKDPLVTKEAPTSNATAQNVYKHVVDAPKLDGKDHPPAVPSGRNEVDYKKRRLVVLRIPKSLRKNCQRILQLQPRPKKVSTQIPASRSSPLQNQSRDRLTSNGSDGQQLQKQKAVDDDRVINKSAKAVANGLSAPRPGEKRRQTDVDKQSFQPPSKRPRPSGVDLSRPQTPVSSALKSPGILQSSSGPKSQLSTPKADRKGTAMDRIRSSEGDAKTPLGSLRSNTPMAPGSTDRAHNREGRSSSNVSTSSNAASTKKDDESAMFKQEFGKYADMAKSLKRAADALAKLPDGQINTDPVLRRQGLAKAIETTLCYMLAFTLKDEAGRIKRAPAERAAWVSLLPYFKFVKSLTQGNEWPQLQGLLYQLEASCRGVIEQCDFEHLERDGNTDETFVKAMVENHRLAKQAWTDGTEMLTLDHIREKFPATWAQRSKAPVSSHEHESLIPNQYGDGGFYLPLDGNSSVLEAVRAGWCFLEEWCKKNGVQWKGKMGL